MGLLRVSMAMGDPGGFRLGKAFRKLRRGISMRNLRHGIRGLAPFAQFIPGGGFISTMSQFAGDAPGSKGGTRAHPSKHGTPHPHAKPSHAHARAAHPAAKHPKFYQPGGSVPDIAGAAMKMIPHMGGAMDALGGLLPGHAAAAHAMGLGGHHRRMNYMNIKAARRAGRRVSGAIRLLKTLEKSLPHVRAHGHITHPHKKRR